MKIVERSPNRLKLEDSPFKLEKWIALASVGLGVVLILSGSRIVALSLASQPSKVDPFIGILMLPLGAFVGSKGLITLSANRDVSCVFDKSLGMVTLERKGVFANLPRSLVITRELNEVKRVVVREKQGSDFYDVGDRPRVRIKPKLYQITLVLGPGEFLPLGLARSNREQQYQIADHIRGFLFPEY
jgi:hypothetical protein